MEEQKIIEAVQRWITDVVIGFNFCPFAARSLQTGAVLYRVTECVQPKDFVMVLQKEIDQLIREPQKQTSLIILTKAIQFKDYLNLLGYCESYLKRKGHNKDFQLASFHPQYLFADTDANDAANYTNRSPFPIIQILREKAVTAALKNYPHPEEIPVRNIAFAREKGLNFMKMLFEKDK